MSRSLGPLELSWASIAFFIGSIMAITLNHPRAVLMAVLVNVVGIWLGVVGVRQRKRGQALPWTALVLNVGASLLIVSTAVF